MNAIYESFKSAILTGFGLLHVEAADMYLLLGTIAAFSILVSFLVAPKNINPSEPLAWGIAAIAIALFIDAFPTLSENFMDAMWTVGTSSVGGATLTDFEDFDGLLVSGYEMAQPIISSLHGWSWTEILWDPFSYFFSVLSIGILVVTNAYLAFRLFILMLSYLVMSLVAMICLPAMMWNQSAFLAEGALKFVAGTGISILGFGIVLSIVWGVAAQIEFVAEMTKGDTILNISKCIVGFILALRTQSLIQGYFHGVPNMGSGIGGTIRSGMYAMHVAQGLMSAARTVSSRVAGGSGGGGNHGMPTPSTNPNISHGTSSSGGFGGAWRQPNNQATSRNP